MTLKLETVPSKYVFICNLPLHRSVILREKLKIYIRRHDSIIVQIDSKVKLSGIVCVDFRDIFTAHIFLQPAGGHKSKLTYQRALRKQRLEYLLINVHLYIVSGVYHQGVAIDE